MHLVRGPSCRVRGAKRPVEVVSLAVLFLCSFISVSCKPSEKPKAQLYSRTLPGSPAEQVSLLQNHRDKIEAWVQRCGASVAKENCGVGDAALFNGLMCLSGDELSCEAVRRSQGVDGRMWRAEHRVASDAVNSFSRDMAMGVLAYLIATRDRDLAQRWLAWIEGNQFRMCRESTDNRCEFTPGFWMLFKEVWEYLGLSPNAKMSSAIVDESVVALLQAHFAPAGYQLHLAGVNALLRRAMGQSSATLNSLTDSLAHRQPSNPFYAYLARGAQPDVVEKAVAWCPTSAPESRSEWSFERDEKEVPWARSMGWECLMLINFLLKELKGNSVAQ